MLLQRTLPPKSTVPQPASAEGSAARAPVAGAALQMGQEEGWAIALP